eukprot:gene9469-3031_t
MVSAGQFLTFIMIGVTNIGALLCPLLLILSCSSTCCDAMCESADKKNTLIAFSVLCWFFGPVSNLLDLVMIPISSCKKEVAKYSQEDDYVRRKLPILYHPSYNITACGIEKIHPFDSEKYGRVFGFLLEENFFGMSDIIQPPLPASSDISLVHP